MYILNDNPLKKKDFPHIILRLHEKSISIASFNILQALEHPGPMAHLCFQDNEWMQKLTYENLCR